MSLRFYFNYNFSCIDEVQYAKDRFRNYSCSSFLLISSYEYSNSDDRKQEGAADSII